MSEPTGTGDSEASEGLIERRIFRQIHAQANFPDGGANIELKMFPCLFPLGTGVFDQDRPDQPRFVEYRDHLLRQADPRFRNDQLWRQWADNMVEAIAAIRNGEDVEITQYSDHIDSGASTQLLQDTLRDKPLEERTVDPMKLRNTLTFLKQTNPAYKDINPAEFLDQRLEEHRQIDEGIIKECAVCHRYACPEEPGLKLSNCGRCKHVYYCGKDHQTKDWHARHKKVCKRLAATLH